MTIIQKGEPMRLIDADALMQTLGITDMDCEKCAWGSHGFCMRGGDFTDACFAIENAPTIELERKAEWIPCSERLPEKEGWYITTVESEKTGKRRIENDLFAVDIALAHGHTPNKFCKDGYRQRTVAWMPFPEPYAERRTDGQTKD